VLSGLVGNRSQVEFDAATHSMKCTVDDDDHLRNDLKRFWSIECVNDDSVVDKFKTDITFDGDRYIAKLPFRPEHGDLSDNFRISKKRLENLRPKLVAKGILKEYDNIFKEYESNGIIENLVRPVVREDKTTTKIRAVFDASAATDGVCLNDCLYSGPNFC